jgi:hypothetical protein
MNIQLILPAQLMWKTETEEDGGTKPCRLITALGLQSSFHPVQYTP